jgi:ribosomal protein S4
MADEFTIPLGHRRAIGISRQIARHLAKPGRVAVGEQRVSAARIVYPVSEMMAVATSQARACHGAASVKATNLVADQL